jgi:hypothetical protein
MTRELRKVNGDLFERLGNLSHLGTASTDLLRIFVGGSAASKLPNRPKREGLPRRTHRHDFRATTEIID